MPTVTDLLQYTGSFAFKVTVDGLTAGDGVQSQFTACSGVKSATEIVEFKHGMDYVVRKGPGRTTFEPVTLERVYAGHYDDLESWRWEVVRGQITRRDVYINYLRHSEHYAAGTIEDDSTQVLDGAGGAIVKKFKLVDAWPSRWESPDLNALGSDGAIEKFELSFERAIKES